VPTCSTIYLDKPMRAHTLMQTIARANRVAPGKESGLIVDYVGVFRALQDALATYARPDGGGGGRPIVDKAELVAALSAAPNEVFAFADVRGCVKLEAIAVGQGFKRIGLIDDAVEAFLATEADRNLYLKLSTPVVVRRLADPVLPEDLRHRHAGLAFLKNRHDLRLAELRLLHRTSPDSKSCQKSPLANVYRSGELTNAPAIADLVGGQTQMAFATMPTVLPQVKADRLRAIAVIAPTRAPALPDVPTIAESLPGFEVSNWIGLFAPAGTPSPVVAKINAEVQKIMQQPDVQQRLAAEGAKFIPTTPESFAAFQKNEAAKWSKAIAEAGIKPQ